MRGEPVGGDKRIVGGGHVLISLSFVMAGLVAAIHVYRAARVGKTWMPGCKPAA